jgi:hypothetical protein
VQVVEIRQRGPAAARPEDCLRACPVARAMLAGEQAWRAALREIKLSEIRNEMAGEIGPERMKIMLEHLQPS